MADAAAVILGRDAGEFTGNFCIDDVLLSSEGVTDFSGYRMDPEKSLWSDFFVPDDIPEVEPLVMAMNPGG
jgi:citronellol/citronellal dehydrogenase